MSMGVLERELPVDSGLRYYLGQRGLVKNKGTFQDAENEKDIREGIQDGGYKMERREWEDMREERSTRREERDDRWQDSQEERREGREWEEIRNKNKSVWDEIRAANK